MNNMILTVGVMILFGTFLIVANGLMLNNEQIAHDSEYTIAAVSIAQSVIDEAKTKEFDQKTVTRAVTTRDSLTTLARVGSDGAGEKISTRDTLGVNGYRSTSLYNDVDDYDSYERTVNTSRARGYLVKVSVNYADETTPKNAAVTMTYCKLMTVEVSYPMMSRSLMLTYAFTY